MSYWRNLRIITTALGSLVLFHPEHLADAAAAEANPWPDFQEVYSLIRSNVPGLSAADLNRAAVAGLLDQLQNRVALVTNAPGASPPASRPLLSKTEIVEDAYAYLRLERVEAGASKAVAEAWKELQAKKKVNGIVLDLRLAEGRDYAAAAEVADLFLKAEQPLLRLGSSMVRSTAKTNAISQPLALLVNRRTSGGAEVLAALLRQAEIALIIGAPTAGQAHHFNEFVLSGGQRLRVAVGSIQLGDGSSLPESGLSPDIRVDVSAEDEKKYLDDPYREIPRMLAEALRNARNGLSVASAGTNRPPRRRINESELVRMRREGLDLEGDSEPVPAAEPPGKPVLHDPALARAIDFLKGLAVVRNRR